MTDSGEIPTGQVTDLLSEWQDGNREALDKLIPLVEAELKRLARRYMRRERVGHTLQTTALVNEAYIRLVDQRRVSWQNRAHFFAVAAQMMRRILIDHAKSHYRAKRGGGAVQVSLDEAMVISDERSAELLALGDALDRLSRLEVRKAQVVEMRYFAGMTVEETAEVLRISPNTVTRDWNIARAWLKREISGGSLDEG